MGTQLWMVFGGYWMICNGEQTGSLKLRSRLNKHCQGHNRPELQLQNLDSQDLTSKPLQNISSKILIKLQLQNLAWTSSSKSWPKCSNSEQKFFDQTSASNKLLPIRSSSATVTTSKSFELASSHASVTSIKFTKQQWVSQSVSQLVNNNDRTRVR